ncbi:MAG: penicillin-binding protein [Treponemataceae bacterium]
MNNFYTKGRIYTFIIICALAIFALLLSYASLLFRPISEALISSNIKERGTIFDREGNFLAIQTTVYNVSITPSAINDLPKTAEILSPIIGIDVQKIVNQISNSPSDFLYLKKKINQGEHDDIKNAVSANKLRGIRLEKTISRIYPENNLASQVIGFMGDSGQGLSGVEYSLQKVLEPKIVTKNRDMYGESVVLTIDSKLQYKLEQVSYEVMNETQAESIMMIAASAKTGEILSYISFPSANLNFYPTSREEERIDRPAMYAYEPGSVFKIYSVAVFIDSGLVKETDLFECDGVYEIRSRNGDHARITCLGKHGWVTAREALQYSCNDALAQMSALIDADYFLSRLRLFGFGAKTGIELPGETRGSVKTTSDKFWSARSKPTISIGQEISVSALQMVEATTAIANGGKPLQLTLISKILDKDGNTTYEFTPKEKEAIFSEKTARYILSCMESTARYGTGFRASIKDVSVGVKTGTAQMADKRGGYSTTDFLSNVVAVFPIENPQIVLYIVITKAQGETYAGRIVAPVIQKAANIIIDYMGLSRDSATRVTHTGVISIPEMRVPQVRNTVPNFIGYSKRQLAPLMNRTDFNLVIKGNGWVSSQNPPAGTPIQENTIIEVYLSEE